MINRLKLRVVFDSNFAKGLNSASVRIGRKDKWLVIFEHQVWKLH